MIPTQAQFDLLYSDYQQLDTPERFGQYIYNRTGFELENSYNETDTQAAWYMLRRAVMINQLTPATDWVKCSERMPETYTKALVLVEVGNDGKQHIFVDELYESTKYGRLWQNNDNLVTHWMPLPALPQEVER